MIINNLGGPVSDKYGRKLTIIVADILFTVGALVMGLATTIPILIIGRILVGVRSFFGSIFF